MLSAAKTVTAAAWSVEVKRGLIGWMGLIEKG
jgi:hypothetical protein